MEQIEAKWKCRTHGKGRELVPAEVGKKIPCPYCKTVRVPSKRELGLINANLKEGEGKFDLSGEMVTIGKVTYIRSDRGFLLEIGKLEREARRRIADDKK